MARGASLYAAFRLLIPIWNSLGRLAGHTTEQSRQLMHRAGSTCRGWQSRVTAKSPSCPSNPTTSVWVSTSMLGWRLWS